MFHLLTLAFQEILRQYNIVDKDSCRTFLHELVLLVQTRVSATGITFDETITSHDSSTNGLVAFYKKHRN